MKERIFGEQTSREQSGAILCRADLKEADLERAYLWGANLRGVVNLDLAVNLEKAHFLETKVTKIEKGIIEEALSKKKLFVVE